MTVVDDDAVTVTVEPSRAVIVTADPSTDFTTPKALTPLPLLFEPFPPGRLPPGALPPGRVLPFGAEPEVVLAGPESSMR